ncbi:CoxG family protein [Pseudonocardia sp. H11422]|uniref:CoxG family protein n=1 Tax=Pseudonocardia sp. H11422 TaxID=2835866 RepID=UPI00292E9C78|nr:SRPBCC domain-containing protein [Pseudonocardia sp. H11422]
MKLREEFEVAEPVGTVWDFFSRTEQVAQCLPGVEDVTVADQDNMTVRATQSLGPMTATFDAKVRITERVPQQIIRFTTTGKSVRGAIGNIRADIAAQLHAGEQGTRIVVDADIALAGAIGSVGQKVVAKQAGKVTATFARNLSAALQGGTAEPVPAGAALTAAAARPARAAAPVGRAELTETRTDPWPRIAAALSAVSALLSLAVLIRGRRR